jgi:hypothetical protein
MTEVNEAVDVDVPTQGQEQEVGLSYGDISASVQIIDVATQRGAIRGDELVQVGTLRERFVAFLRHAKEHGEEVGELPPSAYNAPAPTEASE